MSNEVVAIDYGVGNIFSIRNAVERLGLKFCVTCAPEKIIKARRIILPGVGHFATAMRNMSNNGTLDALNEAVIAKKIPVLGICLGMQLMAASSEEGETKGLNWLNSEVKRFKFADPTIHKIPHVGWNTLEKTTESNLLRGVNPTDEFYFAHSFHLTVDFKHPCISVTRYGYNFVSALEKDNLYGVQFHPEKSHQVGALLLRNFLGL